MDINILISCAGKQKPLIDAFKKALKDQGKVFVADVNKFAAAKSTADFCIESPKFTEKEYGKWCLNICKEHNIKLWISLVEKELIILEDYRDDMKKTDCVLVGAPKENIKKALDKLLYKEFLGKYGIKVPETFTLDKLKENINIEEKKYIVKNRFGRGSVGIVKLENKSSLLKIAKEKEFSNKWIAQVIIEGQEYCLDIVNDLDRNYVTTLIRKRYVMGSQETEVAEPIYDKKIENVAKKISKVVKHQGSIDVEMIRHGEDIFVIDINVRFGGAYIFSHMAGADIPAALIAWRKKEKPNPEWLKHKTGDIWAKYSTLTKL